MSSLLVASTRKLPPVSLDSRAKSLNYLNGILARLEATKAGAEEAILLDCNNFLPEAPGANICIVCNKTIHTPEPHNQLDGITLRVVFERPSRVTRVDPRSYKRNAQHHRLRKIVYLQKI